MDKLVDFSQPIEAHNVLTGAVLTASVEDEATEHDPTVGVRRADSRYMHVDDSGKPFLPSHNGWYIRNTAKPSTPSNEELTQQVVVEGDTLAMLRRVLEIALLDPQVTHEAEKLLAILPKPVDPIDPDLIEARAICSKEAARRGDSGLSMEYLAGDLDDQMEMTAALASIKRGRALELGASA